MISLHLITSLKALSPQIVTLGVRTSMHRFWGNSICNTALCAKLIASRDHVEVRFLLFLLNYLGLLFVKMFPDDIQHIQQETEPGPGSIRTDVGARCWRPTGASHGGGGRSSGKRTLGACGNSTELFHILKTSALPQVQTLLSLFT